MDTSFPKKLEAKIIKILMYYGYFKFAPSLELIHRFFPVQISKKELQISLDRIVKQTKIIKIKYKAINIKLDYHNNLIDYRPTTNDSSLYTLPQYSIREDRRSNIEGRIKNYELKIAHTNRLMEKAKPYIHILQKMPGIQMVGITGSASMNNCKKNDDIDLFIVTKSKSLWFSRFICVVLAKLMGLYGKYVCLNLFFDESDLTIPKQKQTLYIGHELLQLKPVVNKNKTYERMLVENSWIFSLFPNTKEGILSLRATVGSVAISTGLLRRFTERFCKSIQLPIIHKNKTALFLTPTQLWLFKEDFEMKINT